MSPPVTYLKFYVAIAAAVLTLWCVTPSAEMGTPPLIRSRPVAIPAVADFFRACARARNTDQLLVKIKNYEDSVVLHVYEFYSLCLLNCGDEFGYYVDTVYRHQIAPLFSSTLDNVTIYYVSGAEQLFPSRERYAELLHRTQGQVDRCISGYDPATDSFHLNAPRSSTCLPWMVTLPAYNEGAEGTTLITHRPVREGYDDAGYVSDTLRIATSYRDRHY